jgi:trehalose synthase
VCLKNKLKKKRSFQVFHKYSETLTHSIDGTADWLKQLLHELAFAAKLGENGREHVKQNFLLTRHLREYLLLFLSLFHEGSEVQL